MSSLNRFRASPLAFSIPIAIASSALASALLLSGCGGSDSTTSASSQSGSSAATPSVVLSGVVAASGFTPGDTTGNPAISGHIKAGYYSGAVVCIDANSNGKCDSTETQTTTNASGQFSLTTSSANTALLADIGTSATNTAKGAAVAKRIALRASAAQVSAAFGTIIISPMSSEVQRLVEQNNSSYTAEQANLATRLGVSVSQVLADPNSVTGTAQQALLTQDNALTNRYTYATLKLDRGDLYPDALAVPGGDPRLVGLTAVDGIPTAATVTGPSPDPRTPITFLQSQQAAFNIEGVPAYDAIFIVMLENKGTKTILGSAYAPNINHYLTVGNQATTYFATGNPSEPNYTALGGGDDWGITDDNWWGCGSLSGTANYPTDPAFTGGTASDGQPLSPHPALPPAIYTDVNGFTHNLLSGGTACVTAPSNANVVHNINQPNLFTLASAAGLTWRTYAESITPGQDPRADSVTNNSYSATSGNYNQVSGIYQGPGTTGVEYPEPDNLYKTKHHPGAAYQTARNLPEYFADNRTIFGTQYPASALATSTVYPIPAGYNYDQFSTDLASGDVGNINFVMPDQCDDMHSVGDTSYNTGTNPAYTGVPGTNVSATPDPSCTGNAIIQRGDDYVRQVVQRIQASPLWNNPLKHVAIVLMFDEGTATLSTTNDPYNSCCGWNPGAAGSTTTVQHLTVSGTLPSETVTADTSIVGYGSGNHGHGNSIWGLLTNAGPTGIKDSDAYSHFSLVRTVQDMFQLSDPAQDGSYLARAKYTEYFNTQNILNLPEYQQTADSHFDAVRPMNHAYVIPAGYIAKQSTDITTAPRVGPDANQTNIWATK